MRGKSNVSVRKGLTYSCGKIVGRYLVRTALAVCLLWQVAGQPGVARTLKNTREWRLVLVNRAGQVVAAAPTCELRVMHQLIMGQRGLALLIVPAQPVLDTAGQYSRGKASGVDMLLERDDRIRLVEIEHGWAERSPAWQRGIRVRQWHYG